MTLTIVVTHQSSAHIRGCLDVLSGEHVVVVDNASTDGTPDIVSAEFPEIRLCRLERNSGLSAALNWGARLHEDEDILVLNPDARIAPPDIRVLEDYLDDHPEVGVVLPKLVYPDGSLQASVRTFPTPAVMASRRMLPSSMRAVRRTLDKHLMAARCEAAGPVDWGLGAAMLIRRATLRELGGYDERFFLYCEDLDLAYRSWRRGWEVHVQPNAVALHHYARESRGTFRLDSAQTRHHWMSILRLYTHHPQLLVSARRPHVPRQRQPAA